ncbi:MAG TPA: helix-turn-helix domain-containing protein [Alphaproteobacteria bacterium]|mgnify:CR=1 FL=1|nr:helix-turn-helix domain-containing protein [Alphaproteobacteria bacterium]
MRSNTLNVGKKIRELRKSTGLSMKGLAEKVGVSLLTIQRIETDKISPSVALLSDIAYHLNYPLTSLVSEERSVVHIKGNEQPVVDSHKLKLKILAHKGAIHEKMSVTLGKTKKGEFISKHKNEGMELSYIIKGRNIFRYGRDQYELNEGDLVYHDGKKEHSVVALEPSEFLNILFFDE